jgi:hypothetical protein
VAVARRIVVSKVFECSEDFVAVTGSGGVLILGERVFCWELSRNTEQLLWLDSYWESLP